MVCFLKIIYFLVKLGKLYYCYIVNKVVYYIIL